MKFFKNIKDELTSLSQAATKVDRSRGSHFAIMCDMVYCKLRFHSTYDEYLQYKFYNFKNCYRKNFLLFYHQKHLYRHVNNPYTTHLKYNFYCKLSDLFQREIILAPACGKDTFLEFVRKHKIAFMKPNNGSCGIGISIFVYQNDEQALEYFSQIKEDMVCEEYIMQHSALNELNMLCVNTLRIVTLRHDADNIEIVSASLRSSTNPSAIIDNLCSGGFVAAVDPKTGIINSYGQDSSGKRYIRHPISGTQIIGLNIPNWKEAVALVKKGHARLDENVIVAWDIAITETGVDIVEANSSPGPRIMQIMDGAPKGEAILKILNNKKNHKY